MAKSKIDKDDIKRLVENTSNPTSTTSVYSAKYVDDNFANENQTIDFDISNEEPDQTGTVAKTSTWLWQYLTQSINFLWLKLKTWVGGLFSDGSETTNNNYLPKIDDINKKLVKSNISDDGNRVQIDSPLRVNSKTFYNVAQRISNTINEIGTIYIELPFGWTSNMGTYEIDIYNYSSNAKAKIIVSGYNLSGAGGVWINTSLQIVGKLPSNVVRLGYNSVTQKCCILIGNTNSVWGYPQIYVSKVTQGNINTADWSTGWSISVITSEVNITKIVQPIANVGMMLDGKTLTQQITDNNDRYLGLTAKAADSDKLDGKHADEFATVDHDHDYTTSTDVQTLIDTAVASVYKLKGNIANKTALLALTNVKQGDVYNAQSEFNLSGQRVKLGDNIVCISDAATSEEENWDNLSGNQVNRTIHINGVVHLGSATTTPLNFKNTDDISVYGSPSGFGLDISFSSNSLLFRGELSDPTLSSFQSGNLLNGIYDIIPGITYKDVPNESCGTDESKSGMKGSLVSQLNGVGTSLVYHCFNTNNIYICSGTIDDATGNITWSNWKRLLTCENKPQTIQADIEAESIYHLPIPATGTTDYTFYLNGFDGKNGNTIEIDLGTILGIVSMNKRVVEIYVSPAQPNINVSFYCGGFNSFYHTASYTDPSSVSGNIYYMKFIFLKQTTYWSVDNNIAYF